MNTRRNTLILAVIAILAVSLVGPAHGAMVGVNYSVIDKDVTGTAGAVPQANWNNESMTHGNGPKTGGLASLVDNNNATVTGMATSWSANATYGNGASAGGTDTTLLYGGLEAQGAYSETNKIVITGIPYDEYDLYLYVKGWTDGRTGEAKIGTAAIGFNTLKDFPGSHSEATSAATTGTYVL